MTFNTMKRLLLGALVAMSLTGGSLATFAAGHASANTPHGSCYGQGVDSGVQCSTN